MPLEIYNTDYNMLRKKIEQLRETYMQSSDENVRNVVKEQVFYDLCEKIELFENHFAQYFETCKMNSLKEIDELAAEIFKNVSVIKMPKIQYEQIVKRIKMASKNLKEIARNYNETIKQESLTYYSQIIDTKMVFIFFHDDELHTVLCDVSQYNGVRKLHCRFCNSFRQSCEMGFVSNTIKFKKNEYSTLGINCCLDYNKCNQDILETQKLTDFMSYGKNKTKTKGGRK